MMMNHDDTFCFLKRLVKKKQEARENKKRRTKLSSFKCSMVDFTQRILCMTPRPPIITKQVPF